MPKAYVFTAFGGPDGETFTEIPRPVPGPGQLLVAVRAAGVNPADWKRREGRFGAAEARPPLPAVFGREAAGVVEEVGEGVTGFAVGDEVFGHPADGSYAEYALLPAAGAAHKPAALPWTDAAALPVAAGTAYDGLRQLALPVGATLLVNGAGGGVGCAAVQLARHAGLTVVGTASAAKKDFVESLGAVHVPSGPGVADRVRAAAPGGLAGLFDLVGGEPLRELAPLLTDRAGLISVADRQAAQELGGAAVTRDRGRGPLEALAALAAAGVLDPFVTEVFPFAEAGRALRTVEEGHTRGKVVLRIG
ncbi:NADP-dependent oxidoreductase [Streptomyces sp. HPF1205]|uniref:NADP-dependent oxidoreductase n=1 Tax=Streptomyces sp. HPF1205 TaxID=2873262 RepID=UPI001CECD887|nr:NADP-dependent oxidoreductase [Streptomyces sp. HPF1205]